MGGEKGRRGDGEMGDEEMKRRERLSEGSEPDAFLVYVEDGVDVLHEHVSDDPERYNKFTKKEILIFDQHQLSTRLHDSTSRICMKQGTKTHKSTSPQSPPHNRSTPPP